MTKKLLGLLIGALCISTAYAIPLTCTQTNAGTGDPATFPGGAGAGSGGAQSVFSGVVYTCNAPTVPVGDTLTSVTVNISNSFSQGIQSQTNTVNFSYTFGTFAGVNGLTTSSSSNPGTLQNGAATDVGGIVSENPGGECVAINSTVTSCTTNSGTQLSFTITGSSSWGAGGLTSGGSDGFGVSGSYTYVPTASIPEPASLLMVGGGLVGLALATRRRKKA